MPYFSFALSLPLWYAIQIQKFWAEHLTPEGVKSNEAPESK